jgi:type IV pili sensor histidine kinase/response regulator
MNALLSPRCRVNGLWVAAALMSGCVTTVARDTEPTPREVSSRATPATSEIVPVTRYGRYTLVELTPQPAQRNLMRQIIETSIPPTLDVNVGEAMRHVLAHSGYRLCDSPEANELYAFPLPASHLRLGPMTLRNMLLTLAGPAWILSVDDASRQVCFKRQDSLPELPSALAGETGEVRP